MYEWRTDGERKHLYHLRHPDGKPFLFAGRWEQWGDAAATLLTCCLITTDANGTVGKVHDRMPVILAADALGTWLDPTAPTERLQELLAPGPDDLLDAIAVSKLVNSPKNDGPECIAPEKADHT